MLSLISAAHGLLCDMILKLAKKRLCAIWDAENHPKASPRPATKVSLAPSPLSADSDIKTVHTCHDAVFIILFARKYDIPELLNRAFYELLASTDFWPRSPPTASRSGSPRQTCCACTMRGMSSSSAGAKRSCSRPTRTKTACQHAAWM